MANFNYQSHEEIIKEGLIPAKTICDVEVINSEDRTSKGGNEMIELNLKVFHEGRTTSIKDFIVFSDAYLSKKKRSEACISFDLVKQEKSGQLFASDFTGKSGKVMIGIQTDKNGEYPDKNNILAYVKP